MFFTLKSDESNLGREHLYLQHGGVCHAHSEPWLSNIARQLPERERLKLGNPDKTSEASG